MSDPGYKWPLIIVFAGVTLLAALTGVRLAGRQLENRDRPNAVEDAQGDFQAEDIFVAESSPRAVAQPANADQAILLERCGVTMAQADDPNPPLSVRAQPSPTGSIVAEVANDQFMDVVGQEGDWFAITSPAEGWIPKPLTNYGCNQQLARIQFPEGRRSATARGFFVGTGTHRYQLSLERGQRLTLTGRTGPMPQLRSPSNALLFAGPQEGQSDIWQAQVTEAGDYSLVMDSNFQGFDYVFEVAVE